MKHFFDDQNGEPAVFSSRMMALAKHLLVQRRVVVALWFLAGAGGCLMAMRGRMWEDVVGPKPLAWLAPATRWLSGAKNDSEFAAVQGGTFVMGDTLDKLRDAVPHEVTLSSYRIGRHEVTLKLWDQITGWAQAHGYTDLQKGLAKGSDHPVYAITWHDALKWCNARSEMEGRTPCYYEDHALTQILRTEGADLTGRCVRWEADGYRLPTEAEWEMAARGGLQGKRFPRGNEITHQDANYSGSTKNVPYDKSGRDGPPAALMDSLPYTAPVGSYEPNDLGLHDMAGNVWEWCWDFYDKHYGLPELASNQFTALALRPPPSSVAVKNPHGPEFGTTAVVRGGSWRHSAEDARCALRYDLPAAVPAAHVGFRLASRL